MQLQPYDLPARVWRSIRDEHPKPKAAENDIVTSYPSCEILSKLCATASTQGLVSLMAFPTSSLVFGPIAALALFATVVASSATVTHAQSSPQICRSYSATFAKQEITAWVQDH
jgi:hypothetical protein